MPEKDVKSNKEETKEQQVISLTPEQLEALITKGVNDILASKGVQAINKERSVPDDEEIDVLGSKRKASEEQLKYLMEKEIVVLQKDNWRYKDDVVVVYNGYNYIIQRGKPVPVPRIVKMILDESYRQQMVATDFSSSLEKAFEQKSDDVAKGIEVQMGLPGLK